jgi:hypothetical protein
MRMESQKDSMLDKQSQNISRNMKTETEPKIQEVDLIKIKVIQKKHIEGLRLNRQYSQPDFNGKQFLAYITEWDAILLKDLTTGHLGVEQATFYYQSLSGPDWNETLRNAKDFVHNLPQLFLD